MRFVKKPTAKMSAIVQTPYGYKEVEEVPEDYSGLVYAGRVSYPKVQIFGLKAMLGEKIDSLKIDEYELHGVIPLEDNGGIVDCIIDRFVINN